MTRPASSAGSRPAARNEPSTSNFIRQIVEGDLARGKFDPRTWCGRPGPAALQSGAAKDPARIRTRFPPEPNGYLHFGHAKSICLNFGLAQEYGGVCHLRFDDTNPAKEEQEYVDSILEAVRWLGFDWGEHLYHASDYFDWLYEFGEELVQRGHAYVDSLSAEEMRAYRGTLTEAGRDSPYRSRAPEESLDLFRRMRAGEFPDGAHVLRAKIDMASPNITLRDPVIYRIRHAAHHRTGEKWCIYPMYDYTHCISDALENITHSVCTLEFEDHRPLYDWVLERLADAGIFARPLPQQIEFARMNLTYVIMSKRYLKQLVDRGLVDGWDDPRMPTLVGARRRGYTPEGFRALAERVGVSKADQWIEYSVLEECMREDMNARAPRRIAVLDPVRLVIENWPEGRIEEVEAPNHPQKPEMGRRRVPVSRELWIEREDFMEVPSKGYFRLSPGAEVRLRYAFIVKCTGFEKDAAGNLTLVRCEYDPSTRSGTPGAEARKVKGNIHWLCASSAARAEVRLYDRLFRVPYPGRAAPPTGHEALDEDGHRVEQKAERSFLDDLNPDSKRVITACVEPALAACAAEERFQFERHGYFVADRHDHAPGKAVFNRAVTLKESWTG